MICTTKRKIGQREPNVCLVLAALDMYHWRTPERFYFRLFISNIKLELMQNFVKALDKNGDAFKYLENNFRKLLKQKLKAEIFIGP